MFFVFVLFCFVFVFVFFNREHCIIFCNPPITFSRSLDETCGTKSDDE